MQSVKVLLVSSVFVFGAVACGGMDRGARDRSARTGAVSSSDNTASRWGRDPAVVRAEERVVNAKNWMEVQQLLASKGYKPGSRGSVVTDETREAIRAYQRDNRFPVTGLLDSRTLIQMEKDGAGFTGSLGTQLERADEDPTIGED